MTRTQAEKKQYMENLSVLLKSCTSSEEMGAIKDGFKEQLDGFNQKTSDLDHQIVQLTKEVESSKSNRFSWSSLADQAEKVLTFINDNDPQALKTAYYALFDSVIVGPENELGVREIKYILNEESLEDVYSKSSEMVEAEGIAFPFVRF